MSDLFNTGIRPAIDAYLKEQSEKRRDYGQYWSASSAGYCQRLVIMQRLGVPPVPEIADNAARTRTFEVGHIFHEWLQRITKDAGLSIASEVELQDEDLMIRGHFDDLVLVPNPVPVAAMANIDGSASNIEHLILYDYKTAHSASFNYKKKQTEIGHYHKMQLGTYMYMLRKRKGGDPIYLPNNALNQYPDLTEARVLSISKDDLRMHEQQLLWSDTLEKEVVDYWTTLNKWWADKKLPPCTCLDHDGGFMGRRSSKGKIFNDYMYPNPVTGAEEPCSLEWYKEWKNGQSVQA